MRPQLVDGRPFFAGARYMYCPMLLTLTAAVAAADGLRNRGKLTGRAAAIGMTLAFLVVAAAAFRIPATRDGVPTWKAQISVARDFCQGSGSEVTIAPYAAWKILIPCDWLR
jgi:hypothetical protein